MFKKSKSKANIRKRPRSPNAADDDDNSSEHAHAPPAVRSTSKPALIAASSASSKKQDAIPATSFQASKTSVSLLPQDMGATSTQEIDTSLDRDATAQLKRQLELQETLRGQADDGVYRGQQGYATYIRKRDTAAQNATSSKVRVGPMRASASIRVTSRFDYQPDICKDYKETGYCGYGDSCKFMHDRGDYKAGWQLDKDWDEQVKKRQERELRGEDEEESGDEQQLKKKEELPFACLLCRQAFKNPIVTKCGHYFCEQCAIKQFAKSPKCFTCGLPTLGIFKVAKELQEKNRPEEEE